MRALLSRLAPRDWLIVGAGLAVVLGIEMAKPLVPAPPPDPALIEVRAPVGPPVMFPEASQRLVHDVAGLDAKQRAAMDDALAPSVYFTAFAAGEGGTYGWVSKFSTRGAARQSALALCSRGVRPCRIVAEVLPQALQDDSEDTLTFSQGEAYQRTAGRVGPRAFARSKSGAWAFSVRQTVDAAAASALEQCESVRTVRDHLPPMPCEVIAVWHDDAPPPAE